MNDDSTPERIFAITGFIKNIYNAIELIVLKIKEVLILTYLKIVYYGPIIFFFFLVFSKTDMFW